MSSPFLDNIETSPATIKVPKTLDKYSYLGSQLLDDLYSDVSMKTMHIYKALGKVLGQTIIDFSERTIFEDRGEKIRDCGTYILRNTDGDVISANFCRQRLCPLCQKRRSMKTYADFDKIMSDLSDFNFLHLVLTVPNCSAEELQTVCDRMQISSSRLFRYGDIKRAFKGIARCLEITHNTKNGTYHPHFHCMVAVNKSYATSRDYVKQKNIKALWTSFYSCSAFADVDNVTDDVIALHSSLYRDRGFQVYISKADKGALPEIAKYCVKPLSIDLEGAELCRVIEEMFPTLHGRRLIQTYGVIRESAHKLKITFDDESADTVTDEIAERWLWGYNKNTATYGYYLR